jgi:hypothetical protein
MTLKTDKLHQWSTKSIKVLFKSTNKSIGNGEDKLAKELGIATTIGGQNSTHDLKHLKLGKISVKDMTKSDCTLGTDCTQEMRKIFRKVIIPFILWVEKYESSCELATFFQNSMNKKHGSSKITVLEGIDRYELSMLLFVELNKNLEKFKDKKEDDGTSYRSLNSEYTDDIIKNMGGHVFTRDVKFLCS